MGIDSWGKMILLVVMVVTKVSGRAELEFLYDNGRYMTSTASKTQRLTIVYPLNGTETQIGEAFAKVKLAQEKFEGLNIFQTAGSLKDEFGKALTIATGRFQEAGVMLKHAYTYLDRTSTRQPDTNCIHYGATLDIESILADSDMLTRKADRLITTWGPDDMKDNAKVNLLYSFLNNYVDTANNWLFRAETVVMEYDQLRGKYFPPTLKGHIETASCLEDASHEVIHILDCMANSNSLFCELEFTYPTILVPYIEMIPLNYEGVQMRGPKGGESFAKNTETQRYQFLNCSLNYNKEIPQCITIEDSSDCLSYVLHHDIEKAILHCKFEFATPPLYVRTRTDVLLIQGDKDVKVAEGTKVLFEPLPMIIGTLKDLVITVKNDEYTFPARVNATNMPLGIFTTKFSATQLNGIKLKAYWDDFWVRFHFEDYVEWLALFLQLVFAPLTIVGIIIACRSKTAFKRHEKKVEKKIKKCNFEENKTLLDKRAKRNK